MIGKLRRRFVLTAMVSLLIVLLMVLTAINAINIANLNAKADRVIDVLAENDGKFPDASHIPPDPSGKDGGKEKKISVEAPFATRYFVADTGTSGQILTVNTEHITAVTSGKAEEYAQDVLAKSTDSGYIDTYRYRVVGHADGSSLLIFIDAGNEIETAKSFLLNSVIIAGISLCVLFVLVSLLSKRAVQPYIQNIEAQKRFITDAAHELRTPLAIISSNNDVIEMTSEKTEWTDSIRTQVHRMDGLINDLILMSRLEETRDKPVSGEVEIGGLVMDKLADRNVQLVQKNITVRSSVNGETVCTGDGKNIARLIEILLDNAVKYTDAGGEIGISLKQDGKKIHFSIENTCGSMPEGDLMKLFDRFYRADEARKRKTSSVGGYGIGLSMADAIVRQHRGRIRAERAGTNRIRFRFELPV